MLCCRVLRYVVVLCVLGEGEEGGGVYASNIRVHVHNTGVFSVSHHTHTTPTPTPTTRDTAHTTTQHHHTHTPHINLMLAAQVASTLENSPGPDTARIDRMFALYSTGMAVLSWQSDLHVCEDVW